MTKTIDTITEIVQDFEIAEAKFQKKAQSSLKKAFKEFFTANPRIKQIYWTQYTPYFNDGDECHFCVHDMYANLSKEPYEFGMSESDIEDHDGSISAYSVIDGFEVECDNFREFKKVMDTLPDSIYYSTFGDHVQVIANRKGFEVEAYEHE